MDITQWLEDTAAATRPKQPKSTAHSSGPLAVPTAVTNPVNDPSTIRLRSRGRSGDDSSILAPEDTPPEVLPGKSNKAPRVLIHADSLPGSADESASRTNSSASSETSGEPYQRRKRRKTRANKYILNSVRPCHSKSVPRHRDQRAKKMTSNHKVTKRRSTVKASVAAIVRNFDARNVESKRLTLHSATNVGLFKKGRASSPFKGRGSTCGPSKTTSNLSCSLIDSAAAPDLVFSEMNFLQKRKGVHDAGIPAENGKSRRMKERVRQAEEGISAYFVSTRPPLQRVDLSGISAKRRHALPRKDRLWPQDPQRDVSADSLMQPLVEPIEAPLSVTEKRHSKLTSADYFSRPNSVGSPYTLGDPKWLYEVKTACSQPEKRRNQNRLLRTLTKDTLQTLPRPSSRTSDLPVLKPLSFRKSEVNELADCGGQKNVPTSAAELNGRPLKTKPYGRAQPQQVTYLVQQSYMRTESIPLPSSPPPLRQDQSQAQTQAQGDDAPASCSPLQWRSRPDDESNRPRSSSPLARLLKACNACSKEQSSPVFPRSHAKELLEEGEGVITGNSVENALRTPMENRTLNGHDCIRRSWRVVNQGINPNIAFQEPNVNMDNEISTYVPRVESMAKPYPMAISLVQDANSEESDDEVTNATSIQEEHAEQNDGESDVGFEGFWRPNILY